MLLPVENVRSLYRFAVSLVPPPRPWRCTWGQQVEYNILGFMACRECLAFRSNHQAAVRRDHAVVTTLKDMANNGLLKDPAYRNLKMEVFAARLDCQAARKALSVHKESHRTEIPS